MKFASKLSLSAKLIAFSIAVVAACLTISTIWISHKTHKSTNLLTLETNQARGERDAALIQQDLSTSMEHARLLAIFLQQQVEENNTNRESVVEYMRGLMNDTPGLGGVWVGFEADAYDGFDGSYTGASNTHPDGRFMPYFYDFGSGIEQTYLKDADGSEYYEFPKRTKKPFLTPPTQYNIDGQDILMTSAVYPIVDKQSGIFLGVVGFDILLNDLSKEMAKHDPGGTGSVNLISGEGLWVSNKDNGKLGKPVDASSPLFKTLLPHIKNGGKEIYRADNMTHVLIPIPVLHTDQTWSVLINLPNAFLDETADDLVNEILYSSLILLILLSMGMYAIGNKLIRNPMSNITAILQQFEKKNFEIDVPNQTRGDEIGNLARGLENYRLANIRLREAEVLRAEAEAEAERQRTQERHRIADEFEQAVGGVVHDVTNAAEQLSGAASRLLHNAETTAQYAVEVAATSTQTSANVETVATATEELSASINEIASQVAMSSEVVNNAVSEARQADQLVHNLASSADKISEIVTLINDIANQTNLLALNATIEAARAGDAGKGFAVVANEVKNLASQTANATGEITGQIEEIQAETKRTAKAIRNISETIDRVNEVSSTIASAVEEQGAATGEISQNVLQASNGTHQVNASVEEIREQAGNVGDAAGEVKDSAERLSHHADTLNQEVHNFLSTVRG